MGRRLRPYLLVCPRDNRPSLDSPLTRNTMRLSGALRSFIFLAAVVLCGLVAAALFVSALGVFACAGNTCPPYDIGLSLALGAIVGFSVALWLWDVYKKNR